MFTMYSMCTTVLWGVFFFVLLQDTLLQFLLIQLRAHHPLGCHRDDSGGWAANERLWKVCNGCKYQDGGEVSFLIISVSLGSDMWTSLVVYWKCLRFCPTAMDSAFSVIL